MFTGIRSSSDGCIHKTLYSNDKNILWIVTRIKRITPFRTVNNYENVQTIIIFLRFSSNSEADASELIENRKKITTNIVMSLAF